MNVEQHQTAVDPQTKPHDLGCESACRLLSSTTTIAIYYYYSARKLILIYDDRNHWHARWPPTWKFWVAVQVTTCRGGSILWRWRHNGPHSLL